MEGVWQLSPMCLCAAVRPLEVITNILIRSMGPVSEEDMVSDFVYFTVHIFIFLTIYSCYCIYGTDNDSPTILPDKQRLAVVLTRRVPETLIHNQKRRRIGTGHNLREVYGTGSMLLDFALS